MDFALSPELIALSELAHEVGRVAAAPLTIREDSWLRGTSREFALELADRGWLGMTWPVEHGGGGRSPLERFVVFEALISEGAPLASIWFSDRQIGPTLLQFGTDDQRSRYLPDLVRGTAMWCVGMSEPDAGSDVASLRTRAERSGESWVIDGQKVWTSGAAESDWCYLIARTDPDAPAHAGLSEFLVDLNSPGVEIRPIRDMTDDLHFCEVLLDGVEVPGDRLVGAENGAFKQIMRQMEHERGGIDRLVSNRRTYLDALELADLDDPIVRQWVARLDGGYRIGRSMVLREVMGQAPPGFSAVTKTWCTEFEQDVAAFCGHVAGADAMVWGRVARNLCYAPGYTIMGGTTQILRNIIGERLLGLPREPR
ncbi:MAG TPA: acyl-CoA dehydrogenase family protein [Microthrixaceae bacterium]|nr:acyl-CoA dehydrogenase family protein [Microthrixaceae bacterium]